MILRFAILAALAMAPAAAADWRLAGESERGVSYVDVASIAKEGGAVRFERWLVLNAKLSSGADNLRDRFRFDCATRAYESLSTEFFDGPRSKSVLTGGARGTAEPDTVLASVGALACGARKPDGAGVADPYAAGRARLGKAVAQ